MLGPLLGLERPGSGTRTRIKVRKQDSFKAKVGPVSPQWAMA